MRKSLFCFLILNVTALAESWPQFRGPSGQGIVPASSIPSKIDFEKDLVWSTDVPGKGWSSPVMADGLIVLTTSVGEEKIELRVLALSAKTGKIVWDQLVFEPSAEEAGARHAKNSLASSTSVISEGVVYAHFGHMGTAALSLETGKVAWKFHQTYPAMHGNGGSPVLVDDVLIVSADGVEKGLLRGLDAKTGKLLWEHDREQAVRQKFSFGTPLVVPGKNGKIVISQGSGRVGAFEPKTGNLLWWVDYGQGYSIVPRPVADNETVYLTTGFGMTSLLAITMTGAEGDVTKSHLKWKAKRDIPETPSFVLSNDHLYLVDDTGRLSCLNKKSGERLWIEPLMRNVSASLTLVGNRLLTFTEEGGGFVHEVSPEGAKLLAKNEFGEAIFASPIVLEDSLIVRSATMLRRFSSKGR